MALDPDDLNPTDRAILEELRDGRVTPAFVAEQHGYSAGNVRNRMTNLATHGHVGGLGGGLYELVDDPVPENDDGHESAPDDEARRLRTAVDDLQAERDALEQDLAAARERIEQLEDQARQADIDIDRALDELEAALEQGDRDRTEDALERARDARED